VVASDRFRPGFLSAWARAAVGVAGFGSVFAQFGLRPSLGAALLRFASLTLMLFLWACFFRKSKPLSSDKHWFCVLAYFLLSRRFDRRLLLQVDSRAFFVFSVGSAA
jgi:hypothetical protein